MTQINSKPLQIDGMHFWCFKTKDVGLYVKDAQEHSETKYIKVLHIGEVTTKDKTEYIII